MTTFRTDRAPILPPIPQDATPDQQRFFKAVQDLLSENFRSTRQDLEAVDTTFTLSYNQEITKADKHHCICDVWYQDADEIIIKPKYINGSPLLSAYFSDKSYLEQTTNITAKLAAPGAGGHIGDGITAVLNSALYKLWLWNNAGAITPMFTYAPLTTFSNANPTNTLTLGQINAQDIGKLFPVGAHVVVWQDGNELETPYFFSQDGGATTVDVTADKPKVASTTTTVLTLGEALTNATFTAGSTVYQVDGWKPLQLDGTLATGTSGYLDTGIYIPTTAAGAITPFVIIGNEFHYTDTAHVYSDGYGRVATTTGLANYRMTYVPPDKCGIIAYDMGGTGAIKTKPYYVATGEESYFWNNSAATILLREDSRMLHGILSCMASANGYAMPRGYII